MENDPVFLAIWHISDAKRILRELITSSESFDHLATKKALAELEAKVKLLAQLEAGAGAHQGPLPPNVKTVDFHDVPRPA